MKTEYFILFTAGRGPVECAIAVQGIQNKFKKYLDIKKVNYEIVSQNKGIINKSMETIVFKVNTSDKNVIEPWIGTIQWICTSPVRKFHKRKNWYVKCQEIVFPRKLEIDPKDVTIKTFKASGPGGQHRNKVETAVRITHRSSGIMVTASDCKSQAQNKKNAWHKLLVKLQIQNREVLQKYNTDQWTSQIIIERGNPVKTFTGKKFVTFDSR